MTLSSFLNAISLGIILSSSILRLNIDPSVLLDTSST